MGDTSLTTSTIGVQYRPITSVTPATARTIAIAFSRTAAHERKSALYAGIIALLMCPVAVAVDRTPTKGAALAIAVVFAVFCYRMLRTSTRYQDPNVSPVLAAVTLDPKRIAKVSYREATESKGLFGGKTPPLVVVEDVDGNALSLRLPPGEERAEGRRLVEALGLLAPQAERVLPPAG